MNQLSVIGGNNSLRKSRRMSRYQKRNREDLRGLYYLEVFAWDIAGKEAGFVQAFRGEGIRQRQSGDGGGVLLPRQIHRSSDNFGRDAATGGVVNGDKIKALAGRKAVPHRRLTFRPADHDRRNLAAAIHRADVTQKGQFLEPPHQNDRRDNLTAGERVQCPAQKGTTAKVNQNLILRRAEPGAATRRGNKSARLPRSRRRQNFRPHRRR